MGLKDRFVKPWGAAGTLLVTGVAAVFAGDVMLDYEYQTDVGISFLQIASSFINGVGTATEQLTEIWKYQYSS